MKNINKLEHEFANNLSSPNFTILANHYYNKKQYSHALKICKIGLSFQKKNTVGQYIYAKTLLITKKTKSAEKILKEIITREPYHVRAILLLIVIMQHLKRSKKVITQYINQVFELFPNHPELSKFKKTNKATSKKHKLSSKQINSQKKYSHFLQNNLLATKTMYKLFIQQKKYLEAYELLKIIKYWNRFMLWRIHCQNGCG